MLVPVLKVVRIFAILALNLVSQGVRPYYYSLYNCSIRIPWYACTYGNLRRGHDDQDSEEDEGGGLEAWARRSRSGKSEVRSLHFSMKIWVRPKFEGTDSTDCNPESLSSDRLLGTSGGSMYW